MRLFQFTFGYQPHYVVARDFAQAEELIRSKGYSTIDRIDRVSDYVILPEARDTEGLDVADLLAGGKVIGDEVRAEMEKSTRLDEVPRIILRDTEGPDLRVCMKHGHLNHSPLFRENCPECRAEGESDG